MLEELVGARFGLRLLRTRGELLESPRLYAWALLFDL